MAAGSKPGEYRGGRKRGIPNKASTAIAELIRQQMGDWDPVVAMAQIAETDMIPGDPPREVSQELQFAAMREVSQYVHPKRAAVQVTAEVDGKVELRWKT